MTKNTERPIAESGFKPKIAPGDGPGFDTAEYATPERSGVDSGFYTTDRGLPWHVTLSRRLDTPELMTGSDTKLSSKEALQLAGLDYEVLLVPLYADLGLDKKAKRHAYAEAVGKFATVRTDTNLVLGVGMSKGFTVLQNVDAFALGDAIVGESDAHWETAAAMSQGRQVFMSMELPDDIHVEGDPSDYRLFLVISNGHDGRHMLRADVTVERAVCKNTVRIAHERALSSWAIKHTSSMEGRAFEARQALKLSFKYAEAYMGSASKMVGMKLADRQVEDILLKAFPLTEVQQAKADENPEQRELVLAKSTFGQVRDVYYESPNLEGIRGTAYGAFNAVTEWTDHIKAYHGRGDTPAEDVKLDNLMNDGAGSRAKQRAWDLLSAASDPKNRAKVR